MLQLLIHNLLDGRLLQVVGRQLELVDFLVNIVDHILVAHVLLYLELKVVRGAVCCRDQVFRLGCDGADFYCALQRLDVSDVGYQILAYPLI